MALLWTWCTVWWRLSGPISETDLSTVQGIQGSYVITANTHSPSFKELSHTKWDPWVRLFFLSDRVALCIEGAVFPWRRQGATGTYPGSGSALWGYFSGQAGEITLIGCVGYCSPLKLKDFFVEILFNCSCRSPLIFPTILQQDGKEGRVNGVVVRTFSRFKNSLCFTNTQTGPQIHNRIFSQTHTDLWSLPWWLTLFLFRGFVFFKQLRVIDTFDENRHMQMSHPAKTHFWQMAQ